MPDPRWDDIAREAGGLPPEAREKITTIVNSLRDDLSRLFVSKKTRKTVEDAAIGLKRMTALLDELEENAEFQNFGRDSRDAAVDARDLAKSRAVISGLCEGLLKDQRRLAGRMRWSAINRTIAGSFTELLEARTDILGVNVPLQASETYQSGRFLNYLRLCLQHACPELTMVEKRLNRSLAITIMGFQERKTFEPENFPRNPG
jgi:hypothetical protein